MYYPIFFIFVGPCLHVLKKSSNPIPLAAILHENMTNSIYSFIIYNNIKN
jgi:hypothetical protein